MPSSFVRTFSDPDEYAASIRAGTVELAFMARGEFRARLTRIDLHRLWLQRFSDNLPRVYSVNSLASERTFVMFRTSPGPALFHGGVEIKASSILWFGSAEHSYHRSSGAADFAAMSLPIEDVTAAGGGLASVDLTPPRNPLPVTSASRAMARLQRLHGAAGHLAEHAPEVLANADAARGLEQALTGAMVDCLVGDAAREDRAAQGQHTLVMRRFWRLVEDNPERALYLPEICGAIRVSERTLRLCCQEHLGMGPKRYLLLRRMQLARRALGAASGEVTVTDIATRYGFWQLGRFAVEYRALFGEAPSVTLRRRALTGIRSAEIA